ncbi:hypothetical protein Bca52824_086691 [Brassica carinata]|uniref:Uncharacterized protein n=1 Tax=Brassica carinata TaxID=52824 RepID=A0A8X7PAE2_BRACI|nr:hypothetical protein Bca52824_086691 [Brassica carinata]
MVMSERQKCCSRKKIRFSKNHSELADVAVVSSGNNYDVGNMIAKALAKVGFKGVFTLEEGKSFVLLDLERGKVSTLMILLLLLEVRPND